MQVKKGECRESKFLGSYTLALFTVYALLTDHWFCLKYPGVHPNSWLYKFPYWNLGGWYYAHGLLWE